MYIKALLRKEEQYWPILHYSKNISSLLLFSFLMTLPLLFLWNEFKLIHVKVFDYYFIFLAGILSATVESLSSLKKVTMSYSIFMLALLLISCFGLDTSALADVSKRDIVFLMFAFMFTFYKAKFSFNSQLKFPSFVEKLADSSYSTYLFHIPVLTFFDLFLNFLIPPRVNNGYLHDSVIVFLGVPFSLFSGYFIMIYFDSFFKKITFNKILSLLHRWLDTSHS